jgi:DNA-directed RNA polymerase specialized sigma24 family protein
MSGVEAAKVWDERLIAAYREERLALVRLAFLLTGDRQIAEEVVHDAFLALHSSWDRTRPASPFLRTCVVNGCRSWGRRRSLERRRTPPAPAPHGLVVDEMWDAIARLEPRRRAAIVLRFYVDLPDIEIAGHLGVRRATVRTLVRRALADLRREISDDHG